MQSITYGHVTQFIDIIYTFSHEITYNNRKIAYYGYYEYLSILAIDQFIPLWSLKQIMLLNMLKCNFKNCCSSIFIIL